MLKQLCSNEGVALKTMCKDDVTNALLMPVSHMIDGSQVKLHQQILTFKARSHCGDF